VIESGLREVALADAGVAALIGSRLYPLKLPQSPVYPASVYQRISGPRDHDHGGSTGKAEVRIQVTHWATSYSGVKQVAEAFRAALDGYSGAMGSTAVALCRLANEIDGFEHTENDSGDYSVRQDFLVQYTES
jgi:hypothetical protein